MEINKIYNMDCLEGMSKITSNSIDLILTDPPYLISKPTNYHIGGGWNNINNKENRKTPPISDFGEWDKKELNLDKLMGEFYRILKPTGTLLIFYDMWKMQELKEMAEYKKFKQPRMNIWQKTNPVPINSKLNYLSNSREYFLTFVKNKKPTFNSEYDFGLYTYPICMGKERTKHPTQKPLILINELIYKHSNEGDLVLDAFMGSGTIPVSCINTNRNYIGYELDDNYFKIAKDRIGGMLNG